MSKYLIAGAGAIVVLAAGAFFLLQSGGGVADDLRFVSNDSMVIASARIGDIVKSQAYKDMMAEVAKHDAKADPGKDMEANTGVPLSDMVRFTVGASAKSEDLLVVLTTSKAVTASDLVSKMKRKTISFADGKLNESWEARKFTEVQMGSHAVQEEQGAAGMAFSVVGPHTIVYGKSASLKPILERNQKAALSEGMQAALALADQSKSFFVAVNPKGMPKKDMPLEQLGPAAGLVDKVEALAISGDIAADAQLSVVAACKEAEDAEDLKKAVEGFVALGKMFAAGKLPADVTKPLDDLKIEVSGVTMTASTTIKPAALIAAVSALGQKSVQTFEKVGSTIDVPK